MEVSVELENENKDEDDIKLDENDEEVVVNVNRAPSLNKDLPKRIELQGFLAY